MIVYFSDRDMNVLGSASTRLPRGLTVTEDLKSEEVETGVAAFSCKLPYTPDTRHEVTLRRGGQLLIPQRWVRK